MKSQTKQTLVWGGLLILLGILLLVETYADLNAWIWVSLLSVVGLGVFIIYLVDRSEVGLLLLTYVLWAIAGLITIVTLDILQDELIATYILTIIAIPFLVAFLLNRALWAALIPAYILFAVGLMVGLIGAGVLDDLLIPAYVMLAIAIPFFAVFIRDTGQWWALIPGGILTVIGLSFRRSGRGVRSSCRSGRGWRINSGAPVHRTRSATARHSARTTHRTRDPRLRERTRCLAMFT
ncbi:MAG: hypothetical protein GY759_22615 [Chloroflexi bacterium]|nr:hypothetical protein [Chloroflexota bacterium]